MKPILFSTLLVLGSIIFASAQVTFTNNKNITMEMTVVINELMADNTVSVTDPDGEYDDWLELYNNTSGQIDLSGWFMSDKIDELDEWEIPAGTVIEPYGYLIVWCDEDLTQTGLHGDFKLSAGGESVFLCTPQLEIIDSVTFNEHGPDESFSRIPNGTGNFIWQAHTFNGPNQPVSIHESSDIESGLSLFPNPAHDELNLTIPDNTVHNIIIYSILGNIVYQCDLHNTEKIDVTSWPDGLYIVNDLNGTTRKLVIR